VASNLVLMLGMVFASKGFLPGSRAYSLLTIVTGLLLVVSCLAFFVLLSFEAVRSTKVRASILWMLHFEDMAWHDVARRWLLYSPTTHTPSLLTAASHRSLHCCKMLPEMSRWTGLRRCYSNGVEQHRPPACEPAPSPHLALSQRSYQPGKAPGTPPPEPGACLLEEEPRAAQVQRPRLEDLALLTY
jgi:hypothetical protein